MARKLNLDNLRTLTPEEARIIGQKGGKASAIARQKKKNMKECLELLLSLDVKNEKVKEQMRKLGIPEECLTNEMMLMTSVMQKASKGDIQAVNFIRDTSGQKPVEVQEVIETPKIIDDIK